MYVQSGTPNGHIIWGGGVYQPIMVIKIVL